VRELQTLFLLFLIGLIIGYFLRDKVNFRSKSEIMNIENTEIREIAGKMKSTVQLLRRVIHEINELCDKLENSAEMLD